MLEQTLAAITHLDAATMDKCQVRLDNLSKPLNSLLYFERLARQLAGITGNPRPPKGLTKSLLLLTVQPLSADLPATIVSGSAPINAFAAHVQAPVSVRSLADAPAAVGRELCLYYLEQGIKGAQAQAAKGIAILGLDALDKSSEAAGARLVAWCQAATDVTQEKVLDPHTADPLLVLERLADPTLTAMTGALLGAAANKTAVVLDGVAADAAAFLATRFAPQVKEYLIGSHLSTAPVHLDALKLIGMPVHLDLRLSVGQGVGAAMSMILINAALHVLNDMKTFGDAGVAVAQDGPGALKQRHDVRDE